MSEHSGNGEPFVALENTEALDQLYKTSHERPVILFKHSLTCPISSAAYDQMSKLNTDVALVVVQKARNVSSEVATRTGIPHESPQAIVLRGGEAVWNASHWRITVDAVEKAVRENA
jgi:bacillithiol system protein YtxJ